MPPCLPGCSGPPSSACSRAECPARAALRRRRSRRGGTERERRLAWRQTRLASGGRCVRGEVPEVLAYPLHSSYLPPEAVHLVVQVEGRGYGELYVPAPRAARAPKEVLSVPEAIPVGAEAAPREGERAVARQRRCRCLGANAALVSSSLSSYLPYCAISASPPSLPDSLRINSAPLAGFGEARRISKKKKAFAPSGGV